MDHDCKFENLVIEMHGDIKGISKRLDYINGTVADTKTNVSNHETESDKYRHQISVMWAGVHAIKWFVALLVGSGLLGHLIWGKLL